MNTYQNSVIDRIRRNHKILETFLSRKGSIGIYKKKSVFVI